jgi:hypothetical protein
MSAQHLDMVSVLPNRDDNAGAQSSVQLIRYLWELALPRTITHRPPVLSTLWIIKADAFKKLGGTDSVKRMVVPEAYFAKELSNHGTYSFIRSNGEIAVESAKRIEDQRQTALRVRYPQLHKRPELVLIATLIELVTWLSPYVALWRFANSAHWYYIVLACVILVAQVTTVLLLVVSVAMKRRLIHVLQGLVSLPLDIWLTHYSLYKYEFGSMPWKERNVCLPVMHVIPSLPKID